MTLYRHDEPPIESDEWITTVSLREILRHAVKGGALTEVREEKVRIMCLPCNGAGEVLSDYEGKRRCIHCGGTRWRTVFAVIVEDTE